MKKNSIFSSFGFKIFLIVGLTIVTSSAITYGFYIANKSQTGTSNLETTCFDVTFTEGASISLKNATSMTDASGQKTKPYTFSVTNNCDNETSYTVILSSKSGSFDDEFISTSLNNEKARVLSTILENKIYEVDEDYSTTHILAQGSIKKGETAKFDLRLWINAKATYEDVKDKTWEGEVKVVNGIKEVEDLRILSNKMKTIAKTTTPDFTKIETTDAGVYTLEDNDGTSYYYRGANTNNYLKLGNLYFRILRLNGDGSLRVYYDEIVTVENTEETIDRLAAYEVAPLIEGNDANLNTELDNWYRDNITNKDLEKYLTSSLYCQDTKSSIDTPQFKCTSPISKKVGLLTLDEVVAAGASLTEKNDAFSPFKGHAYWLYTSKDAENMYILDETGKISTQNITTPSGLVPVINISKEYISMITGTGSIENPYTL